jgi:hypothetical protein
LSWTSPSEEDLTPTLKRKKIVVFFVQFYVSDDGRTREPELFFKPKFRFDFFRPKIFSFLPTFSKVFVSVAFDAGLISPPIVNTSPIPGNNKGPISTGRLIIQVPAAFFHEKKIQINFFFVAIVLSSSAGDQQTKKSNRRKNKKETFFTPIISSPANLTTQAAAALPFPGIRS